MKDVWGGSVNNDAKERIIVEGTFKEMLPVLFNMDNVNERDVFTCGVYLWTVRNLNVGEILVFSQTWWVTGTKYI